MYIDKYFGSKLNTVLLLILIILMVVAIKIMVLNKDTYIPFLSQNKAEQSDQTKSPAQSMDRTKLLGNADDLVSFSIWPGTKVHGVVSYQGVIKGGYFFEGNIVINVLDKNKTVILKSNAVAKGDWMTSGPVSFEGNLDFSKFAAGPAYIEIHNDNASDLPQNDKSVLIPVVIQ